MAGDEADAIIGELLMMFCEDAPQRLAQLREFYADKNAEQISRTAHALKGSCATLGASKLTTLCAAVELEARGGSIAQVEENLERIETELESVKNALREKFPAIFAANS